LVPLTELALEKTMAIACKSKQRGITFLGLIFMAIVMAFLGVIVVRVTPTIFEYLAIQKAVQKSTEGQSPAEVRAIFTKASMIDDIKSVTADQLDISKQGDKVVVGFSYESEIHLIGPAYLTMKYKGQSN
jgi:hypothetical protein